MQSKVQMRKFTHGGRTPKTYSTKSLLDHLHRAHSAECAQLKQKASKTVETTSSSTIRLLNDKPGSSTEKQPTLTDLVEPQQPFGVNHPMQRKLNHLVREWIVGALLPYNTVKNGALVRLLKTACPRFAVPSAKYLRTCLMPDIYNKVKNKILELIHDEQSVSCCSLTTDMWSCQSMDAYMALTIHFIKKAAWQRKSAVLQCLPFAESHTAENLLLALESAFSEYKIRERLHLVVRDNAANIVKAVNDGDLKHVGCFLHGLHLVVTNSLKKQKSVATLLIKIRSIVREFRHSTKAKSVLMKAQEREGMPRHTWIIDQETRWGSTYLMLEGFAGLPSALLRFLLHIFDKTLCFAL